MRPMKMIWSGGVMVVAGWILIFAIVLGYVPSTFFFNFFGYGISFVGLLLGLVGMLDHIRPRQD